MSLVLNESLVLAKTRSQDLKSILKLNCWNLGVKDVSLVRKLINVEIIGLSCNEITTLEDFAYCTKLKELILRKNKIKNIAEVAHLQRLPKLTNLWLDENPCVENTHNYRKVVLKALPNLTVLDNIPVTREELQEIEELGNEIYEEIQYESSSSSSGSGPSSTAQPSPLPKQQHSQQQVGTGCDYDLTPNEVQSVTAIQHRESYSTGNNNNNNNNSNEQYVTGETSYYQLSDSHENSIASANSQLINQTHESHFTNSMMSNRNLQNSTSRSSNIHQQPARCLSLQGSVTTLNGAGNVGQHQGWNNNNNMLPKGGKSRNGNILSAVLCLVKELDYVSCEVVQTALHCRMEETSQ